MVSNENDSVISWDHMNIITNHNIGFKSKPIIIDSDHYSAWYWYYNVCSERYIVAEHKL